MSTSVTGPHRGTKISKHPGPSLVGQSNETEISISGIITTALIDTGSYVSSLSHSFYLQHLQDLELKPISDILKIECADGKELPYKGYTETSLSSVGIPGGAEQPCLLLVVPDTSYNSRVPVLIGTNILSDLLQDCKSKHGDQFLQRAKLHTPWYLAFRCMTLREKELKRNKERVAIIRSVEPSKILIGPYQSINIRGYLDKELGYTPTCTITAECEDFTTRLD